MTPIATRWSLYGCADAPWWLVAATLACAGACGYLWLRAETRGKAGVARALPCTGAVLVALIAWCAWKPVLVKVVEWEHRRGALVCVDASASMDTPVAGTALSTQLDVLALGDAEVAALRPAAAQELRAALARFAEEAASHLAGLSGLTEALAQGLPPGRAAGGALEAFTTWVGRARPGLEERLARVEIVLEGEDLRAAPAAGAAREAIAALRTALRAIPAAASAPDAAHAALASSVGACGACLAPLAGLQAEADARFVAGRGEALAPRLEEVRLRSRRQMARMIVDAHAPPGGTLAQVDVPMDETDLYDTIERAVTGYEDEGIADLVLLSDGGQNAPRRPAAVRALRRAGVTLTTVGIGTAPAGIDRAVVDWRAPRLARRAQPFPVSCTVKAAPGRQDRFALALEAGTSVLASGEFTTTGEGLFTCDLRCGGLDEGRHVLTLRLTTGDTHPGNDAARFVLDVVARQPRAVLVGDLPDWDTIYFVQAAARAGFSMRQAFTGASDEPPERGGSSRAIPGAADQWAKHRLVVLTGAPFRGIAAADADALHEFVAVQGGSLLVLAGGAPSYAGFLAGRFGWDPDSGALDDRRLRLAAGGREAPALKLGSEGAGSARRLAALGAAARAWRVPPQHLTLVENARGAPVVSLGFYGKGKVYLWGIEGLWPLREYDNAEVVDRLLEQVLGDAGAGVACAPDATVAVYPPLPAPGRPATVIAFADGAVAPAWGARTPLDMVPGTGNRIGTVVPPGGPRMSVAIGGVDASFPLAAAPGSEEIYHEFSPSFLASLAAECGGRYVDMGEAPGALGAIAPATWRSTTAARYPLADHWILLLMVAAAGAAHWVVRKLSGLAI